MPLVVCPTPIGNLEDVTLRVLRELGEADAVLCEDTRHTRVLLERILGEPWCRDASLEGLWALNGGGWFAVLNARVRVDGDGRESLAPRRVDLPGATNERWQTASRR